MPDDLSSMHSSFDVLWEKVLRGDEEALANLVEEYGDPIRRAARRLLGRSMRPYLDTVDIMQIVQQNLLVGVRENRFEISEPAQLIALAITLVRRSVARQWRSIKKAPKEELPDPNATASTAEDPAKTVALSEAFQKLVATLDEVDRQLLEFRLMGYRTSQIARMTDADPAVLRVRLSRLRKRLRASELFDHLPPI